MERHLARAVRAIRLTPPRWSGPLSYASAPAATLLTMLVQAWVFPHPGIAPFVLMYVAPVLAAWVGGRGPGLLAVALSALVGNYAFLGVPWRWDTTPEALAATVMFLVGSAVITLLCASFRETVVNAERTAAELRQRYDETQRAREALREANLQLEEADRRKDEFLAVLSHELRTPLAPIKNSLYLLERSEAEGPQARRAREIMERQVDHMTRLVSDLLDVSRITHGKIRLQCERIDLREVVGRTIEDLRSGFTARRIELHAEQPGRPVWVDGDATRLGQALGNLLHNAAKFTNDGGAVSVTLRQEGETAVLQVRDSGVGIAPAMLGRIFQPFTQADRTLDRSTGGLGLGLALVKGVVELHGGEVSAHSDGAGKGSEFTLRLPARPEPAAAAQAPLAPARRARRVLVIEDNEDAAETLQAALELNGHEVAVAFDGPRGLERARAFGPEAVLCDIGLPGMDGYAVARAFRSDAALRDVALVALTGYALPEDVERAKAAGFDRHLAKPPDLATLERVLSELPGRQAA
jgi:two-component system CheB/CheR fusion protein